MVLSQTTTEKTILRNLLRQEEYARKSLPFLKEEYFTNEEERVLFKEIKDFILEYNALPTFDTLYVEVDRITGLKQDQVDNIRADLKSFEDDNTDTNLKWLVDSTESFCQDKAIYLALTKAIEIMGKKNGPLSKGAIPGLLSDALSVSFDPNVGHDYLQDFSDRYDYYHQVLERIPFDLEFFNKITKGGIPKKTLNIILAGTGVGKSLFMCHMASSCLTQGKNVLYITLELAEEEVAKRIDANLMDITFDQLMALPKNIYDSRAAKLKAKTNGRLIIKEYPTAGASVLNFKALLNELKLKKSFVPDIIFVDYINICTSSRIKPGNGVNSYTYIKSIAEELRGMAVEFEVPVISATQTTRSGFTSSDPGLEDTSESFGLPATADFMFALINAPELEELNQLQVKQLKNRYNDASINKRFVIGIDRSKMKVYDVEASAQKDISDSGQVDEEDDEPVGRSRNKFKGLRV